ncbi:hypothetical protein C8250_000425 [Streptomyces sp. So13.3]|uniref:hypothetical protein n=1 Tax=Streptomyces TaxID=1883 RepID=UPI0011059FA0|nr:MULTISPECIES: hypothetical protein [unclassified Streptomyces]MCZ4102209.1 hypothetical protein [Streptomyces sp. H39-C1]QNA70630.1 hypothetical protein C8250_000425 [Streptomyces sp. So13.3]
MPYDAFVMFAGVQGSYLSQPHPRGVCDDDQCPRFGAPPGGALMDFSMVERRRGCRNLTGPERDLALRLAARADRLRTDAGREGGEDMGVAEAFALAAV